MRESEQRRGAIEADADAGTHPRILQMKSNQTAAASTCLLYQQALLMPTAGRQPPARQAKWRASHYCASNLVRAVSKHRLDSTARPFQHGVHLALPPAPVRALLSVNAQRHKKRIGEGE